MAQPWLIDAALLLLGPLVVLVPAWLLAMRHHDRTQKAHIAEVNGVNAEILKTNREMLAELRELRKALAAGSKSE